MAEPSYGGTNDVNLLDIGQDGGSRQSGGLALATMGVEAGQENISTVMQSFPQQHLNVQDVLGFKGQRVLWRGTIWALDVIEMATIEAEIEQHKAGRYRDPRTGEVTVDLAQIKATRLTQSDRNGGSLVLSVASARLVEYRPIGPRQTIAGSTYTVMQEFEISFEILADA